jgi:hypothetical protein
MQLYVSVLIMINLMIEIDSFKLWNYFNGSLQAYRKIYEHILAGFLLYDVCIVLGRSWKLNVYFSV